MKTAAAIILGIALLAPASFASAAGFSEEAAKAIGEVVRIDPPRFALVNARENYFVFYGRSAENVEEIRCERSANFDFVTRAGISGSVNVGICAREANRIRALAVAAQGGLKGSIGQLSQSTAGLNAPALEKLGWTYARQAGANGAEEHSFPVIVIGRGLLSVPTAVLVPRGGRRAVIVQAEAMRLCEISGLGKQTPLCTNTRQALTDIARRVAARFPE